MLIAQNVGLSWVVNLANRNEQLQEALLNSDWFASATSAWYTVLNSGNIQHSFIVHSL